MHSPISLPVAAFLGITAVGLGAFGAHGLEAQLAARGSTDTWETATLYHLVHATVFLVASLAADHLQEDRAGAALRRAGLCWLLGIVLFSGSLYTLALGGPRWLGPVTPLGGVLLILGWFFAGWAGRRRVGAA